MVEPNPASVGLGIRHPSPKWQDGEQLRLLAGEHPDRLVERAKDEHRPITTVCLFSGGHDSTVLAHRCREHYDRLVFIDTGTAVPGVAEWVRSFADWIGKPLVVMESGAAYRDLVLGTSSAVPLGMPGPGTHGRCYTRLKERQIEATLRREKEGALRDARVLFLSGVRRDESKRRAARQPLTRKGSSVFCNPLIDWTNREMREYREQHSIPESDVAALLHKSGECNCGAYAAPGEREMLEALWPEWWDATIGALERECAARGLPARWGERPDNDPMAEDDTEPGALCTDCQLRFETA